MRVIRKFFVVGVLVALTGTLSFADDGDAVRFNVPIDSLANQPEPGSGLAEVTLANGRAEVEMQGLRTVPHDDPLGVGRIVGYAAWLVNSESALGKLNLGFLFPEDDGDARLTFSASGADKSNLSRQGFNMVVITAETVLDLTRPQPSGPPIAAGHIPGTPAAVTTTPPAVEVFMGDLTQDVFGFQGITITIFSGQSIRWTNVSPAFVTPHTVTRTEGTDPPTFSQIPLNFDSGSVPFGGSFTRQFTLPTGVPADVYGYHCTPHLPLGMTGRIVVVARPAVCMATLSGSQEVPPVTTSATGSATVQYTPLTGAITYDVSATGLSGVAAHIHQAPAGVNGPIIVPFEGGPNQWSGQSTLTPEQGQALLTGGTYANVHTSAHPGGEIRGQLQCQ